MIASYSGADKRLKYLFDNATEVSYEQIQGSGTAIGTLTIDGSSVTVYAPSGGGSNVSYTPIVSTGTKIGILSIDGTPHDIYIPDVSDYATDAELASAVATLQASFQDGVDRIYDACVRKGSTPASHSLADVVTAILNIGGQYVEVNSSNNVSMVFETSVEDIT